MRPLLLKFKRQQALLIGELAGYTSGYTLLAWEAFCFNQPSTLKERALSGAAPPSAGLLFILC